MAKYISLLFDGEYFHICIQCGFLFCGEKNCKSCAENHIKVCTEGVITNSQMEEVIKQAKQVLKPTFCKYCEDEVKTLDDARAHGKCASKKGLDVEEFLANIKIKEDTDER